MSENGAIGEALPPAKTRTSKHIIDKQRKKQTKKQARKDASKQANKETNKQQINKQNGTYGILVRAGQNATLRGNFNKIP